MSDSDPNTAPGFQPNRSPDYTLMDKRLASIVEAVLESKGYGGGGGGQGDGGGGNVSGHIGGMRMEERVGRLEADVGTIKTAVAKIDGSLDWAKIAFGILATVLVGGLGILIAMNRDTNASLTGLSAKIVDEFRSQRQDQAAQITAISNAITAAKQAPPQVLLVPAPPAKPQSP